MATLALPPLGSSYRIPAGATVYTSPTAGYPNTVTAEYAASRPGMPPAATVLAQRIVVLDLGLTTERVVLLDSRGVAYGATYATATWLAILNGTAAALSNSIYGSVNDWPQLAALSDLETVYGWTVSVQE